MKIIKRPKIEGNEPKQYEVGLGSKRMGVLCKREFHV